MYAIRSYYGLDALLGVREYIRKHEAPFGVGIAHFDRFAATGVEDVIGLVGVAADHVLDRADEAVDGDGQLQLADGRNNFV